MNLALFDLDGTLIEGDSDHGFGEFLIAQGWADGEAYHRANEAFYKQYQAGCLDIHAYIRFCTAPWRDRPLVEQQAVSARFMAEVVQAWLKPAAIDLVQAHQRAGDRVAIVTATNEFITRPIATAFGVETLIAVQLERDGEGRATGCIAGVPSFREGKITRVEAWLAADGLTLASFERSYFYSDSTNDLPLLERVTDPVATNPSPALDALARERGWRILRLFR